MAADNSFDIVSEVDFMEASNAVQQAMKEIRQRFDFKGSASDITLEKETLTLVSDDENKLESVVDILQSKLVKRGVSLRALDYGKVEPAAKGTRRRRRRRSSSSSRGPASACRRRSRRTRCA
jgi:uncharacterized protein YajQ (UPF0234 family)